MLFDGNKPSPPPWATVIDWNGVDVLVDRHRFVLRIAQSPLLTADWATSLANSIQGLSPVPLALRYVAESGAIVFDILQTQDSTSLAAVLANLDAVIHNALPLAGIEYLAPDPVHVALTEPNDEFFHDWPYQTIRAAKAWDAEAGDNPKVTIGIIDSGIALSEQGQIIHPDFDASRFDLGTNFVFSGSKPHDDLSHGTPVAAIAAAQRNNNQGVPGMTAATRAHICKTLRADAHGNGSDFGQAVNEIVGKAVAANRKVVINYSAGTNVADPELEKTCDFIHSKGMLLCAAAGTSDGILKFPAGFASTNPNVIAVGGIHSDDKFFGPLAAEIFAPAIGIRSAKSADGGDAGLYQWCLGTSIATPFVTGIAALIWSRDFTLTAAQVKQRILGTARMHEGRRILDAAAALSA